MNQKVSGIWSLSLIVISAIIVAVIGYRVIGSPKRGAVPQEQVRKTQNMKQ